jgi:hypothetical protein
MWVCVCVCVCVCKKNCMWTYAHVYETTCTTFDMCMEASSRRARVCFVFRQQTRAHCTHAHTPTDANKTNPISVLNKRIRDFAHDCGKHLQSYKYSVHVGVRPVQCALCTWVAAATCLLSTCSVNGCTQIKILLGGVGVSFRFQLVRSAVDDQKCTRHNELLQDWPFSSKPPVKRFSSLHRLWPGNVP